MAPGTSALRFYGELADLVVPARSGTEIAYRFEVGPSVKDAIEALGVPHTEVDLILVDGEAVGLDHRLAGGEHVGGFPAFRPLGPVPRPRRPALASEIRFLAAPHLAALTRYLRLLGFDAVLDPRWRDEELAGRAQGEGRVLLTRDRGLLKRRAVTHGVLVRDDDPDDQLVDVVRRLDLGGRLRPFTRCMACNGVLADAEAAEVAGRVPPGVMARADRFRRCSSCGRVYWDGSHRRRLDALVARARAAAGRPAADGGADPRGGDAVSTRSCGPRNRP